jgi:hypothetical protein
MLSEIHRHPSSLINDARTVVVRFLSPPDFAVDSMDMSASSHTLSNRSTIARTSGTGTQLEVMGHSVFSKGFLAHDSISALGSLRFMNTVPYFVAFLD